MTKSAPSSRAARPKPPTGVRIARLVYATIPIAAAAAVFLGSFI
jgi:hypothetical protein